MTKVETGGQPINLSQALKLAGLADSGGQAKSLVADGQVRVNGEVELRKRRQLAVGDVIEVEGGARIEIA